MPGFAASQAGTDMNRVAYHQLLQLGGSVVFVEKIFKSVQLLLEYGVIDAYSSLCLLCEGMLEQREFSLAKIIKEHVNVGHRSFFKSLLM
jgi:hypothetical protein